MFGRATIGLGIGPRSSSFTDFVQPLEQLSYVIALLQS